MNQTVRKEVSAVIRAVSEPNLDELPPPEAYEDHLSEDYLEAALKSVPEEEKDIKLIEFSFVNLRDSLTKPKHKYDFVLKGLLCNTIGVLAGTGGIGKSSLLLGAALGLADPNLDVYKLNVDEKARKVMILFAEDDKEVVSNRFQEFCNEHELDQDTALAAFDSGALRFTCDAELMKSMKNVAWLKQLRLNIVANGIDVIVFDTYSVLSGVENENDNAEAKQVLLNLKNHILVPKDEHKVSIILTHHTNESGDLRGAKTLKANTRAVYIMRYPLPEEAEQLVKRNLDPADFVRLELNKCNYEKTGTLAWFKRGDYGVLHMAEDKIAEALNSVVLRSKANGRGNGRRSTAASTAAPATPEDEGDGYASW